MILSSIFDSKKPSGTIRLFHLPSRCLQRALQPGSRSVSEGAPRDVLPRTQVYSREISVRNMAEPPPAPTCHQKKSPLSRAVLSTAVLHRNLLLADTYYPPRKVRIKPGRCGRVLVISGATCQAEAITPRDMVSLMQGVVHLASCVNGA